jgi:hypothetical protein
MGTFLDQQNLVFAPEDVQMLADAFDDAWGIVQRLDGVDDGNRESARLALAKRVVVLFGQRGASRHSLGAAALASFGIGDDGG